MIVIVCVCLFEAASSVAAVVSTWTLCLCKCVCVGGGCLVGDDCPLELVSVVFSSQMISFHFHSQSNGIQIDKINKLLTKILSVAKKKNLLELFAAFFGNSRQKLP